MMAGNEWFAVENNQANRDLFTSRQIPFEKGDTGGGDNVLIFPMKKKNEVLAALDLDMPNVRITRYHTEMCDLGGHSFGEGIFFEITPREKFDAASARQEYLKHCSRFADKKTEKLRAKLEERRSQVEELQRELVKQIRAFNIEKATLDHILGKAPAEKEAFFRDFEELLRTPHVVGAIVDEEKISVFTDRIVIVRKDKKRPRPRDIGEFRIDIHFDGEIEFYNLTQIINGYDHPHIEEHDPCLGNISETIPDLIADYQFAVVTAVAIKYLQSYNEDNPYCPIEDWPTVKKRKKRSLKAAFVLP